MFRPLAVFATSLTSGSYLAVSMRAISVRCRSASSARRSCVVLAEAWASDALSPALMRTWQGVDLAIFWACAIGE